jgi:beta-galactosidase
MDTHSAGLYKRGGPLSGGDSPYQISLNGDWRFLWVQGCEVPAGVTEAEFDDSNWDTLHVPGVWQRQGYGTPYYYAMSYPQANGTNKRKIPQVSHGLQEIGVHRRTFTLPEPFAGREVYLCFGAAKAALQVFVNGREVGYSQGSMTPHEFNVTDTSAGRKPADGNRLGVRDWTSEDQDMWFFSGIYRDVTLDAYLKPHSRLLPSRGTGTIARTSGLTLEPLVKNRSESKPRAFFGIPAWACQSRSGD